MADNKSTIEERLREVCCIGDEENVKLLVERGVSINASNAMNGWTPLHWAAKRGHSRIVKYLLQEGIDTMVVTKKGETAAQLASDADIRRMLGEEESMAVNTGNETLPIVPNYLRNPEFFYAQKSSSDINKPVTERWGSGDRDHLSLSTATHEVSVINERHEDRNKLSTPNSSFAVAPVEEIVLKLRIADSNEKDFIEVDFDRHNLTFHNLQTVCCEELGIEAMHIKKIRKLPNTIVRNDKDMKRLLPCQELEVVLTKEWTS